MKKIYFLTVLIISSVIELQAQNVLREFGKISKDEIDLKVYAPDKDAEAVVLFDVGKSYFIESSNSFDVVFERTTRIKILTEAGVKWSEVEIPFYQEGKIYEKVRDIEAFTYNYEDGKLNKIQFDVSNTYDEKKNDHWNIRKFAIPDVKAGSIIEYRYKIYSEYKFNFRDWEFQWRIPVMYSEYEARMIPFYEYTYVLQGASKLDVFTSYQDKGNSRQFGAPVAYGDNSYNDMVYKYGMKNVPAFKDEEYVTSIHDFIIMLNFQLSRIHTFSGAKIDVMTTWEELIKELLKHSDFGNYIKKSEKQAPDMLELAANSQKTDTEKFNIAADYIKSNFNWNNNPGILASQTPNKFIEEKHGNCADLNLFAIGLLNKIGIEAYPVILSTRDHGKIKIDYPFVDFFNYVIIYAKIDGKIVLSDMTEILSLNDRIPPRCINDKGLIVKKDNVEWVELACLFTSTITTNIQIGFRENELFCADLQIKATEYDALNFRNDYSDRSDVVKEKLAKNHSIIDSTIAIQNQFDKTNPYVLKYRMTAKPEIVNDKIYISPFFNESIADNPLKQKDRQYPIDLTYPQKRIFITSLSLPEGYQVEFVPEEMKIDNELFELNYSTKIFDQEMQVSFDYFFKKPIYQSTEYAKIKDYFKKIVQKGNEKIVLSKRL